LVLQKNGAGSGKKLWVLCGGVGTKQNQHQYWD